MLYAYLFNQKILSMPSEQAKGIFMQENEKKRDGLGLTIQTEAMDVSAVD